MEDNRRFYLRMYPSQTAPIRIAFRDGELTRITPCVRVKDISIGGIGLELSDSLPGSEELFLPGTRIEEIGLTLPFEGPCIFSGVVKFMFEALRGIEFLLNHVEQKKVARYIYMREMEVLGRNTSHWGEEAVKRGFFDTKRYKWMMDMESVGSAGWAPPHSPGKKKILVVDPAPESMENYRSVLSSSGELEAYYSDGTRTAELALETRPDLILMDLSSPDPDGALCNAMRRLKRYPALSQVPIFMVAACNRKEAVLTAMRYGADDFIIKTAGEEFILGRIKEYFRKESPG